MITNLKRSAKGIWEGTGQDGSGKVSTRSGALKDLPYSARSRFKTEDGVDGSNPEELIAAAHAACFNMALSFRLNGDGYTANTLETEAKVFMGKEDVHWYIARIELHLKGDVPGISEEEFGAMAEAAKQTCPISKALRANEIQLFWELV